VIKAFFKRYFTLYFVFQKLRKTNIVRSPGGTPLVRRNPEDSTGDGLTPALAHALRKKFQVLRALLDLSHL